MINWWTSSQRPRGHPSRVGSTQRGSTMIRAWFPKPASTYSFARPRNKLKTTKQETTHKTTQCEEIRCVVYSSTLWKVHKPSTAENVCDSGGEVGITQFVPNQTNTHHAGHGLGGSGVEMGCMDRLTQGLSWLQYVMTHSHRGTRQ